jgi:16S rRNA (cytosine967-C5)-methyltransferase
MDEGLKVRRAALSLVLGVTDRREALSDQLARGGLDGLDAAGRARSQRLALATLRRIGPADLVLKPFLRKEPPPEVRAILRLALVEMQSEGSEPHGVVNASVDLTRAAGRKAGGFAGLVNAVLRRVAMLPAGALDQKDAQALPGWLRGRLQSAYGKTAVIAMERAHARGAAIDLTARDDAADLARRLGATLLPTGSVRLAGHPRLSDLPGFAEGAFWVQDAAAALPARTLAVRRGERALDLCAAPGGKTLQLAAAGAEVTALDLSAARMARVEENLIRCRLTARTVVADALDWQPDRTFDALLLDAPCSSTGTIRRHPDLPFVRDPSRLKEIVALQARLLDRALGWLAPGGRLVFSTCSLLPDEGERQVVAAMARHPDLRTDPGALALPGIESAWIGPEGGLRLRPDRWNDAGGMDGFYIAVFRRG